jgi:hypothetical protein
VGILEPSAAFYPNNSVLERERQQSPDAGYLEPRLQDLSAATRATKSEQCSGLAWNRFWDNFCWSTRYLGQVQSFHYGSRLSCFQEYWQRSTRKELTNTGSPTGIAAGFFLAQHKRQLGGNKMIVKITVFKALQPVTDDEFPTIIFWVQNARNIYGGINGAHSVNVSDVVGIDRMWEFGEPKVLKRSADGKSVIREHVVRVEL